MRQPSPRFQEGDTVVAVDEVRKIKRSVATRGGNWVYVLEGSNVLWEERLLHLAPRPAAEQIAGEPKSYGEREPGEEG